MSYFRDTHTHYKSTTKLSIFKNTYLNMPDYATGDTVRYKPIGGELLHSSLRDRPLPSAGKDR